MRILVFPDIHQARNLNQIEITIQRERPNLTVFSGDYFDQFGDSPADAAGTAEWLHTSLEREDRIHLIGNHDLSYFRSERIDLQCPGYTEAKFEAIRGILARKMLRRMRFHYWSEHFLFSHAGVSNDLLENYVLDGEPTSQVLLKSWLNHEEKEAWKALDCEEGHWFWATSPRRGGIHPFSGLLWCDFREFQPVPGVHQVFGHTPSAVVRRKSTPVSENLCVDTTNRSGWHHYALIDGESWVIRKADGSPEPYIDEVYSVMSSSGSSKRLPH